MQATIPEFVGLAVMSAVILKMMMNAGSRPSGGEGAGHGRGFAWLALCLLVFCVSFYTLFVSTFR
jgi:hypothetical protein